MYQRYWKGLWMYDVHSTSYNVRLWMYVYPFPISMHVLQFILRYIYRSEIIVKICHKITTCCIDHENKNIIA